jgi:hypothetical protein
MISPQSERPNPDDILNFINSEDLETSMAPDFINAYGLVSSMAPNPINS